MQDEKYVVFKKEDWEKAQMTPTWGYEGPPLEPLADAVVIRRQDEFAPAALHTYANSIAIAAGAIGQSGGDKGISQRLQNVADYFHEQAVQAEAEAWKLPD